MKKLKRDKSNSGWTIDFETVSDIGSKVDDESEEYVGMEEAEAVMLAMVKSGYAELEEKE